MEYLILKWAHIISATILFGTGIGSTFHMFMSNRSKNTGHIYLAVRHVVIADWLFTAPAVVVQPASGVLLVDLAGHGFGDRWVVWALVLYGFAGVCWLPVVWMQIKMRDMAKIAAETDAPLPPQYWTLNRWWISLGSLAFPAVIVIFYLMVFRPT